MREGRRRLWGLTLAAAALTAATALPALQAPARAPARRAAVPTLRLAEQGTPNLDPAAWDDPESAVVIHALDDTLVAFGPHGGLVPDLARSWRVEDGGLRYVFRLRSGVRFADGHPVTAAAVAADLDRLTSVAARAPYAPFFRALLGYAAWHAGRSRSLPGVVAHGRTLVLRLARPASDLLAALALPCAAVVDPKAAARRVGPARRWVGSGPYVVRRLVPGRELVLVANPRSADGPPAVARVVLRLDVPIGRQLALFAAGRLDLVTLTASPAAWLRVEGSRPLLADLRQGPYDAVTLLALRPSSGPLRSPTLRRALALALVPKHLAAYAVYGEGEPPRDGLLVPGVLPGRLARVALPHDPAAAARLLRHLGVDRRHPLRLLDLFLADPQDVRLALALTAELGPLGVDLLPLPVGWDTYRRLLSERGGPALVQATWAEDFPDPEDFFDGLMNPSALGVDDPVGPLPPGLRRLLREAAAARGRRRDTLYAAANRAAVREALVVPLFITRPAVLVRPGLRAPSPRALGLAPPGFPWLQDLALPSSPPAASSARR